MRTRTTLTTIGVAVLTAATGITLAPAVSASQAGHNGRFAYADTAANGNTDIYALKPTGESALRLTTDSAIETDPQYIPGGKKLSFIREAKAGAPAEMWTMNADGSGKRRIAVNLPGECAQLSPDGGHIALNRHGQVWIGRGNGTGFLQLTYPAPGTPNDPPQSDGCPEWSPSGHTLAYSRSTDGYPFTRYELRIIAINGTADHAISSFNTSTLVAFSWKPDGKKLVLSEQGQTAPGGSPSTAASDEGSLSTVNVDGTGGATLDSGYGVRTGLAWSPDGQRIAFSHQHITATGEVPEPNRATGLYTMRASDGGDIRLKRAGIAPPVVSWQATP